MLPKSIPLVASGLLLLALAPSALTQHSVAGPPPEPDSVEVPVQGVAVAMQDFDGRPVVDIRINGKGPYRFVVGSAATVTLIDPALSKELALPEFVGVHAAPVGGHSPKIVRIDELRLGGAVVRGAMGAALTLDAMWQGANAPRGVLSPAVFPGHLLTFDYPGKQISIEPGTLAHPDAQTVFVYTESRPTVPLRIAGRPVRVPLDTASPRGLMLPMRFLGELPIRSAPKAAKPAATPAGTFPVTAAQVNGAIELGRYTVHLSEVLFSDVSSSSVALGSIGNEALRSFVVTLDSRNHQIRLVSAERN